MTRTGPQKYPGASTAYWYQDNYGGSAMESNVAVWHTTEGTSLPGYGGGASAPNFTALPDIGRRRLRWYQHFDFDTSSRALMNLRGGVETNTLNAVQIELVGTCDPSHRTRWGSARVGRDYLFWPDAPGWALKELGRFVRWAHEAHGLRMRSAVKWTPYPESYGGGSYRLTGAEWRGYYGHLGHQHVPENDHGDPGNLNFARVLEHARGTATTEEDDMPISDDDAKKIAREVWDLDTIDVPWNSENAENEAENAFASLWRIAYRTEAEVKAQRKVIDKLADALGQAGSFDPAVLKREIREAIESITVRLDASEGA